MEYNLLTKSFFPAWDRSKYIKVTQGYSGEFCHNIVRMIMRPNSTSIKHWFVEAINWLNDAIGIKITTKTKPVWYLFSFILDRNDKSFPIGTNFEYMYHKVRREIMYGGVTNSDISIIKDKVIELYKSINPDKVYSDKEVYDLFYGWYNSIPGAITNIEYI